MFFSKQLTHELLLHPRYFGRDLHKAVVGKLYSDVEGTCSPRVGYIVAVTAVNSVGDGRVLDGRGAAVFEVVYTAVVWRPFKDEVVDAVVTDVSDLAIFADIGPTTAVIHRNNLPAEYLFQKNANPPCYQTADQSLTIAKDSVIRIKILNVTIQSKKISVVAEMRSDYLGVVE